jgi:hypothetical protein
MTAESPTCSTKADPHVHKPQRSCPVNFTQTFKAESSNQPATLLLPFASLCLNDLIASENLLKLSLTMDPDSKPSLRISHIVYGRKNEDNRVLYLVDSIGDEFAIPEDVVLIRWRRRRHPNASFSGERLGPHLWRALAYALGKDCSSWPSKMTESVLNQARKAIRASEQYRAYPHSLPSLSTLEALWSICGQARLQKLVDRHADPNLFGVPDLFLFAREHKTQKPYMGRFVEVKKPEEPVSLGQREEIAFMNDLGLHARLIRLIERE